MAKIDEAFLNKAIKKGLDTIRSGEHLDLQDPSEIGKFIFGILASGLELIPGYGDALAAVLNLFSSLIFQPKAAEDIWVKLFERIKELVDQEIQEYHLETLKVKLAGLEAAMNNFSNLVEKAENGEDVPRLLYGSFSALNYILTTSIFDFASPNYAVASLPWFALAATLHLKLLGDGIQHGPKWGYSSDEVNFLQETFDKLTASGVVDAVPISHEEIAAKHKQVVQDMIRDAPKIGVPEETVEIWKAAIFDSSERAQEAIPSLNGQSYVAYAKEIYELGRRHVKPEWEGLSGDDKGAETGATFRAKLQYDADMTIHVLNYVDFWPFLSGKPLTDQAMTNLDREIYASRGRYDISVGGYSWRDQPFPAVPRKPNEQITAVYVGGITNVEMLQMKYGDNWGTPYGSTAIDKATTTEVNVKDGEYIYWVDAWFGHKLGCVQFWSNESKILREVGGQYMNASTKGELWYADHQVTSVYGINYESHPPSGLEGIIVGFRPLYLKSD
ncbi:Delta endotoxin [Fusarium beomiforme]|uniref:Delta endotoxin n=1 Tax=Fusarium beomiforme TaxID=44412 RepID=A0A9P5A5Y9_9HYPO|nr:Delta endotoxin [Fusarium beomiforme]